jgi:hypothetical protein
MSDEAKIHVSTGFSGGISVNLRAETAAEFEALVAQAVSSPSLLRLMTQVGLVQNQEQGAVQVVQAVFPQSQVIQQPQSTVGQPLPSPVVQQPVVQQQPAGSPPGVAYPGNCPHGSRVYVDKPARGKAWQRWECAIPWAPGQAKGTRCEPINV